MKMTHRPFSELKKDWPPERLAEVRANTERMLAELYQREQEQAQKEGASQAASRKAPGLAR